MSPEPKAVGRMEDSVPFSIYTHLMASVSELPEKVRYDLIHDSITNKNNMMKYIFNGEAENGEMRYHQYDFHGKMIHVDYSESRILSVRAACSYTMAGTDYVAEELSDEDYQKIIKRQGKILYGDITSKYKMENTGLGNILIMKHHGPNIPDHVQCIAHSTPSTSKSNNFVSIDSKSNNPKQYEVKAGVRAFSCHDMRSLS